MNICFVEDEKGWCDMLRSNLKRLNIADSNKVADCLKKIKKLSDFHRNCEQTYKIQMGGSLIKEISRDYAKSAIFQRFIDSFLIGSDKTQKTIQGIGKDII